MAISPENNRALPEGMVAILKAIRRRQARRLLLTGCLAATAAFLLIMVAVMGLDWLLVMRNPHLRMGLLAFALVMGAFLFGRFYLTPLRGLGRLSSVARQVDKSIPALQERWSTVMELSESSDPPEMKGAPSLLNQVGSEAHELERLVSFERVAKMGAIRPWLIGSGAAVGILAIILAMGGEQGLVLMQRFFLPYSPVALTRLEAVNGDRVVPRGEEVILEARMRGRMVGRGELQIRSESDTEGAQEKEIPLRRALDQDSSFKFQMASADRSFDYRFIAGDGQTPWHHVEAVDRPNLDGVRFKVTPPQYSQLPLDERDELPRRYRALEQSRFELALHADKAVETFELRFEDKRIEPLQADADGWHRYAVTLEESFTFEPRLVDAYGLENSRPPNCRIFVYADMPPVVKIKSPTERMKLPPDSKVSVEFEGTDDFGLAEARLLVEIQRQGGEKESLELPVDLADMKGAKNVSSSVELDLAKLDLRQGDQLSLAVEMTDTRDLSGESSVTGALGKPGQTQAKLDAMQKAGSGMVMDKDGKDTESDSQKQGGNITTADGTKPEEEASPGDSRKGGGDPYPFDREVKPGDGKNNPQPGNPPPPWPDELTMRAAFGPSTTCSNSFQIEVDQWAGGFDGQEREKLQLDIDRYIARMKELLTSADGVARQLVEAQHKGDPWLHAKEEKAASAEKDLAECLTVIDEVHDKALGSPYAFAGHQLKDIGREHVHPARGHLGVLHDADPAAVSVEKELTQAAYHIARALGRLEDMTREYERVKREEKMQEQLARLEKMHQLFIEDMMLALKSSPPSLNPRDPLGFEEVDEELVEQLKERYEKIKALMEELTRLMAEDPELARRMAAVAQLQGRTLRDQLTLLTQRQQTLCERLERWTGAPEARRAKVFEEITREHVASKAPLVARADSLRDNYRTWMPRKDVDPWLETLDKGAGLTQTIALDEHGVLDELALGELDAGLSRTRLVNEKLQELGLLLGNLETGGHENDSLSIFTANRMDDTLTLDALEKGWIIKVEAMRKGELGRAESVDQYHLMNDTLTLADKLENIEPMLRRLSAETGDKALELVEIIGDDVPASQDQAVGELKADSLFLAGKSERQALGGLQKAEACYDELLDLVEEEVRKMPPTDGFRPVPTIEEYLKMLENELKACEKLGAACRLLNISINGDWMLPGDGMGSGSGSGSGPGGGQGTPTGNAMSAMQGRLMRMMQRAAQAQARQISQSMDRLLEGGAPAPGEHEDPGADRSNASADSAPSSRQERDWNTVVSRLKDELAQGRGNEAPEAYRTAIEEYFRNIVDMTGGN